MSSVSPTGRSPLWETRGPQRPWQPSSGHLKRSRKMPETPERRQGQTADKRTSGEGKGRAQSLRPGAGLGTVRKRARRPPPAAEGFPGAAPEQGAGGAKAVRAAVWRVASVKAQRVS